MPWEQELPQEKVRGGAVYGMSVSSQTRGLLCPPLCFSQLVGSCIVSCRGISAPRHAESLHRDRFGQKEGHRVGPAFSGCVMGFSCSTFMISGTW